MPRPESTMRSQVRAGEKSRRRALSMRGEGMGINHEPGIKTKIKAENGRETHRYRIH
jgi:hypothetical protein